MKRDKSKVHVQYLTAVERLNLQRILYVYIDTEVQTEEQYTRLWQETLKPNKATQVNQQHNKNTHREHQNENHPSTTRV
jgi:hypothetical protein